MNGFGALADETVHKCLLGKDGWVSSYRTDAEEFRNASDGKMQQLLEGANKNQAHLIEKAALAGQMFPYLAAGNVFGAAVGLSGAAEAYPGLSSLAESLPYVFQSAGTAGRRYFDGLQNGEDTENARASAWKAGKADFSLNALGNWLAGRLFQNGASPSQAGAPTPETALTVPDAYAEEKIFGDSTRREIFDQFGLSLEEGWEKLADDKRKEYTRDSVSLLPEEATAFDSGIKLTEPILEPGGKPRGVYEPERSGANKRSIELQNETADFLAAQGYDVEMLREKKGGNGYGITEKSNPDYLINGEAFDCYSPDGASAYGVWKTVQEKTEKQANRIIVNLSDYKGSLSALYDQFQRYKSDAPGLVELLVYYDGAITRWLP